MFAVAGDLDLDNFEVQGQNGCNLTCNRLGRSNVQLPIFLVCGSVSL